MRNRIALNMKSHSSSESLSILVINFVTELKPAYDLFRIHGEAASCLFRDIMNCLALAVIKARLTLSSSDVITNLGSITLYAEVITHLLR